jgi:tetratricopeptide (TPR) repeat protein
MLTVQRNNVWHDDVSIYQDTLIYHTHEPKLHYNLGNAYLQKNMLVEATEEYQLALSYRHDYACALNKLGDRFRKTRRLPKSV